MKRKKKLKKELARLKTRAELLELYLTGEYKVEARTSGDLAAKWTPIENPHFKADRYLDYRLIKKVTKQIKYQEFVQDQYYGLRKRIQFRMKDTFGEWHDCRNHPRWYWDDYDYRVKPEKKSPDQEDFNTAFKIIDRWNKVSESFRDLIFSEAHCIKLNYGETKSLVKVLNWIKEK